MHGEHRLGAPAREAFEQDRRTGIADGAALGQHRGKRLRVPEAEINTLSGQRMHPVGSFADKRHPMGDGRGHAK